MYNSKMPTQDELPSSAQLLRSTLLSIIVAAVLLVGVVMPAEFAIDPTGIGRLLGLTEMGEIKERLADEAQRDRELQATQPNQDRPATSEETLSAEAEPEQVADVTESETVNVEQQAPTPESTITWRDEVRFTLSPGEGTEYKLSMDKGAKAQFSWASEGGPVNYDTHGDGSGQSISYEKGRGVPSQEGELVAAFTGKHGWFFRNRNKQDVELVLRTRGDYGQLKHMY